MVAVLGTLLGVPVVKLDPLLRAAVKEERSPQGQVRDQVVPGSPTGPRAVKVSHHGTRDRCPQGVARGPGADQRGVTR